MKYITVNFVLLLLFFISFSLGDELGFPESIGNTEGTKKRSLDLRNGNNAIGVLPAAKMPAVPVQNFYQGRPRSSDVRSFRMQTMMPRPVMSTPRSFERKVQRQNRPLMSEMTQALSLPLGVPPFKTIPKDTFKVKGDVVKIPVFPKYYDNRQLTGAERFLKTMASSGVQTAGKRVSPVYADPVPAFMALPSSITSAKLVQPTKVEYFPSEELPQVDLKGHTVEELAAAANVDIEVIQDAIKLRQQQLMLEKKMYAGISKLKVKKSTTVQAIQSKAPLETTEKITTQSTTTTKPSTKPYVPKKKPSKKPINNGHKVMNAPKEYYPGGYEKNYDDNFKTRIDLPATSFHCGDQRHFPGLYADQELGCMVFHVCALTDDGLIMKSFLCPESTLFDQTILKCNWWFYTDCKSSKTLYDSNLPVSKSYQLMKSLSYFNKNYKSSMNATADFADIIGANDDETPNDSETPNHISIITATSQERK